MRAKQAVDADIYRGRAMPSSDTTAASDSQKSWTGPTILGKGTAFARPATAVSPPAKLSLMGPACYDACQSYGTRWIRQATAPGTERGRQRSCVWWRFHGCLCPSFSFDSNSSVCVTLASTVLFGFAHPKLVRRQR